MKLLLNPHPQGADPLVARLVQDAHARGLLPAEFLSAAPDDIEVGLPHRIRELGLADAAAAYNLRVATPVGYRYLLRAPAQAAAQAAVDLQSDGADVDQPMALVSGLQLDQVDDALGRIRAYPGGGPATLSLLVCRGLNVSALVTDPGDGGEAWLFPLQYGKAPLPKPRYLESEFCAALRQEAARLLEAYALADDAVGG